MKAATPLVIIVAGATAIRPRTARLARGRLSSMMFASCVNSHRGRIARSLKLLIASVLGVSVLLASVTADADEVRVMTSGAFEIAYLELAPHFKRATGHLSAPCHILAGPQG
jgi:hypothetical protein